MAVFLTPLATIEQRAVEQECLGGEGLQWRVWEHEFFRACARSGLVGWCLTCMMGGAWRLWSKACHCSVASSRTPLWSVRGWIAHVPTVPSDGVALQAARRRKERTKRKPRRLQHAHVFGNPRMHRASRNPIHRRHNGPRLNLSLLHDGLDQTIPAVFVQAKPQLKLRTLPNLPSLSKWEKSGLSKTCGRTSRWQFRGRLVS